MADQKSNGERPELNATFLQHELWLRQFASLMEYQSRQANVPPTPFRSAVVTRLRWAADHISKLERDLDKSIKMIAWLERRDKMPNILKEGDPDG